MNLVLGIGNRLLGDDAVGPLVIDRLLERRASDAPACGTRFVDGGTVGLALLPVLEGAHALIAVDAANFDAEPGCVAVFFQGQMDHLLRGRHRTAHEVALLDLMQAAALCDGLPARRALVAIQPQRTGVSPAPSAPVAGAIELACAAVEGLLHDWSAQ